MITFFDKTGRDRIIHDFIQSNKPAFIPLYENVLIGLDKYKNFNALFIFAFEAGYAFAKASRDNREPKVDYEYQEPRIEYAG